MGSKPGPIEYNTGFAIDSNRTKMYPHFIFQNFHLTGKGAVLVKLKKQNLAHLCVNCIVTCCHVNDCNVTRFITALAKRKRWVPEVRNP